MFLVKGKESRDFNVFLGVWKREKNVERSWTEGQISKKCLSSRSDGCLGLFIAPGAKFKAVALQGPLALMSYDQVALEIFGKILTS